MNGKKAKRLRTTAKITTKSPEMVAYEDYASPVFAPVFGEGALKSQVISWKKVVIGKPRVLKEGCVRAVYQSLK